jgi:hypothetical protein
MDVTSALFFQKMAGFWPSEWGVMMVPAASDGFAT